MNTNSWKFALPLLATTAAAAVGIWVRPTPAVNPMPSTQQSIANSTRDSVAPAATECPRPAAKPSRNQSSPIEDLLQGCADTPE